MLARALLTLLAPALLAAPHGSGAPLEAPDGFGLSITAAGKGVFENDLNPAAQAVVNVLATTIESSKDSINKFIIKHAGKWQQMALGYVPTLNKSVSFCPIRYATCIQSFRMTQLPLVL